MTRMATDMPTDYEPAALPWSAMSSSPRSDPERLDVVRRLSRDPTVGPAAGMAEIAADEFCRLACLVYSEVDGPERWARARSILAAHPDVVDASIAAAACAADPDAIAAQLVADPQSANREVGPFRWSPLLYLTYSRVLGVDEPAERFLRSARILLDAGANPNAGYLWRGLTSPFTVLTGVFGEGEQGAGRQPRHPQSEKLARLLLTAGADPNDGQTLYNRMFRPDDGHLQLLFEFGLGRMTGGPWAELLGADAESPAQMFARQLGWAIDHGFSDRVELLIANGVDLESPLLDGRTPAVHAITVGYRDIIEDLRAAGVTLPTSSPKLAMVGALLAGDGGYVAENPEALAAAKISHPGLIHRARTAAAVALLGATGFDLNARAGGSTALHNAAFAGDVDLITALLAAGADRGIQDTEHSATALGWAEYGCHPAAIRLLTPLG